ncbi:MAG: FtsW/RodA/SpoVE family cell cycle protein, partial [Gammaproteobacteria bacterium]
MTAKTLYQQARLAQSDLRFNVDVWLLGAVLGLLAIGLMMMGSASVAIAEKQFGEPFYYLWRQALFIGIALMAAWAIWHVPIEFWNKASSYLLIAGLALLVLVLLVGKEVNGSTRWLSLGVLNVQPSELIKLFVVVFLSSYLVRRGEEVRTTV